MQLDKLKVSPLENIQNQFNEKIQLFIVDPTLPALKVHPLKGNLAGYRSMHINGDVRALYIIDNDSVVIFV